jgi:hypothetical protein
VRKSSAPVLEREIAQTAMGEWAFVRHKFRLSECRWRE